MNDNRRSTRYSSDKPLKILLHLRGMKGSPEHFVILSKHPYMSRAVESVSAIVWLRVIFTLILSSDSKAFSKSPVACPILVSVRSWDTKERVWHHVGPRVA